MVCSLKIYKLCGTVLCFICCVMNSSHLGVGEEEEGQSTITLPPCGSSAEIILGHSSELKEQNYMGLSDCSSSVDSSAISISSQESRSNMNLKATELRLGLPGSQSPERDAELGSPSSPNPDDKPLFPLHPFRDEASCLSPKSVVSSNKRGFSVAMSSFTEVLIQLTVSWSLTLLKEI